jgi:hypothetical protein
MGHRPVLPPPAPQFALTLTTTILVLVSAVTPPADSEPPNSHTATTLHCAATVHPPRRALLRCRSGWMTPASTSPSWTRSGTSSTRSSPSAWSRAPTSCCPSCPSVRTPPCLASPGHHLCVRGTHCRHGVMVHLHAGGTLVCRNSCTACADCSVAATLLASYVGPHTFTPSHAHSAALSSHALTRSPACSAGDLATQYFADRDIFCAGRVRTPTSAAAPQP